jgi:hypothetical protein
MSKAAFLRCVIAAAAVAAWLGQAQACGFDTTPMGAAVCVEGQSAQCACEGGESGLHTCSQGEFGACACAPSSGAGLPGAGGSGASASNGSGPAGSAASTVAGTAGEGGAGATGGSAGTSASAGAGAVPAAGGAGAGAGSGAAGSAGQAGSGGEAGSAGGGAAGWAGSWGGAGRDGTAGDGLGANPGELYGFCAQQDDCQSGLYCLMVSIDTTVSGYCAPPCTLNDNGTAIGSCPVPPSGDVQAQCAPLVGLCVLGSCENKDCPTRMQCVQTTSPFGQQANGFDCRYPAR